MSKTIRLSRAYEIGGAKVEMLTMREPTVNDQLVACEITDNPKRQEVVLFANLCEVTPDDLGRFSLPDYFEIQKAYQSFIV